MVEQLLPIVTSRRGDAAQPAIDFIYEPSREQLLEELVPQHLAIAGVARAARSVAQRSTAPA